MMGSSATDRDLTVQRPHHASLLQAGVVELADTPALGAGGASRGGSNPSARMEERSLHVRAVLRDMGELDRPVLRVVAVLGDHGLGGENGLVDLAAGHVDLVLEVALLLKQRVDLRV